MRRRCTAVLLSLLPTSLALATPTDNARVSDDPQILLTQKGSVEAEKVTQLTQQLNVLRTRENEQGQEVAQLMAALEQARTAMITLQASVDNQVNMAPTLAQAQAELKASQEQVAQLQATVGKLQRRVSGEEEVVKTQETALAELQDKLDASEKALSITTTRRKPSPDKPTEVRDYAVGTSLANEMLALLTARAASGVSVDKDMALAGVQDTFGGTVQVPEAALQLALSESDKAVDKGLQAQKRNAERDGQRYMTEFSRKPGVKKDPDGTLYRIDYAGQGAINESDTVVIVTTESLPDGTVVKDMEQQGRVISHPLKAYPPLFQKVIRRLNNHGSVTVAVPPDLAYGDTGNPPLVPPGATIIFNLRVCDVIPDATVAGK